MVRVLIIEDEIITAIQLEAALVAHHMHVVASLTDCSAMPSYLDAADLLIMDIPLGSRLSLDCLEQVSVQQIPIIFISMAKV